MQRGAITPGPEPVTFNLRGDEMRVALVLRVSSGEQHTENQRPDLESLAERRGGKITAVYEFEASAWKGAHQKILSQIYQDARLGKFDAVLVWALDRLSREGVAATLEIVDTLGMYGV